MLSRFTKPSFRDRFTVSFLDRDQRMVKMRIRRRGLPIFGRYVAETWIGGDLAFEIHGNDPDMLMHCLVREAWNGGARHGLTAQEARRAVIAD